MGKRRGRKTPPKTTAPPTPPSTAKSPVTPTEIVLPGAPWDPPPDSDLGQAPRGFDSHGRRSGAVGRPLGFCGDCPDHEACATGATCEQVRRVLDRVELRADGEVIATVEIEPPQPTGEDELPALLPPRLLRWMDRSTQGVHGDLVNALLAAGWTVTPPIVGPPTRPSIAYPPGADQPGWPFVPLPATLDNDRETRNLVVALRRIGTFDWEDD